MDPSLVDIEEPLLPFREFCDSDETWRSIISDHRVWQTFREGFVNFYKPDVSLANKPLEVTPADGDVLRPVLADACNFYPLKKIYHENDNRVYLGVWDADGLNFVDFPDDEGEEEEEKRGGYDARTESPATPSIESLTPLSDPDSDAGLASTSATFAAFPFFADQTPPLSSSSPIPEPELESLPRPAVDAPEDFSSEAWIRGILEENLELGAIEEVSATGEARSGWDRRWIPSVLKICVIPRPRYFNGHRCGEIIFGEKAHLVGAGPEIFWSRTAKVGGSPSGAVTCASVMEFVGSNLDDVVHVKKHLLTPVDVMDVTTAICDQLVALRAINVAHGDLKLLNVCVSRGGPHNELSARLIDFGFARERVIDEARCRAGARRHQITGTCNFYPPEKRSPQKLCDCRVDADAEDVWHVGLMIWELLQCCGRLGPLPHPTLCPAQYVSDGSHGENLVATMMLTISEMCAREDPSRRCPLSCVQQTLDYVQYLYESDNGYEYRDPGLPGVVIQGPEPRIIIVSDLARLEAHRVTLDKLLYELDDGDGARAD